VNTVEYSNPHHPLPLDASWKYTEPELCDL